MLFTPRAMNSFLLIIQAEIYLFVYNLIYFYFSSEGEGSCSSEPLRMLYDAQDTLTLAGRTVQKQGHQIDAACSDMNKIHNDLAVADTLIYNLDSWFSKWKIKAPQVQIKVHGQSIPVVIEKSEYPIVYAKTQRAQHLPGTLVVSSDTLDVLNAQNSLDISFLVREVTEVSVHTPWEATIAQSRIGQAVHTVHLIAARLVHILQKLEVLLPGKINYEDPAFDTGHQNDELDFDEHTPGMRRSSLFCLPVTLLCKVLPIKAPGKQTLGPRCCLKFMAGVLHGHLLLYM